MCIRRIKELPSRGWGAPRSVPHGSGGSVRTPAGPRPPMLGAGWTLTGRVQELVTSVLSAGRAGGVFCVWRRGGPFSSVTK